MGRYLEKKYAVIIPFLPGFGYTKSLPINGYREITEGLETFLEKLNVKNPTVFGVSLGGMLALSLALRGRVKVKRVVVDSPWWRFEGLGHHFVENFERKLVTLSPKFIEKIRSKVFIKILLYAIEIMCPKDRRDSLERIMVHWRKRIVNLLLRIDIRGNIEIFNSFKNTNLGEKLKTINCPVVLIGCDLDDVICPAEVRRLQEIIGPKARYVELSGLTHSAIVEDPKKLAEVITQKY
jgi:pimeloyl-ACP methyl ester carboxylesterase